jgi:hypothetical protein
VRSGNRASVWCGKLTAPALGMNPTRSLHRRTLLRTRFRAWGTTRGPRCFRGLRSQFLLPSHLAPVPTILNGRRPLSRTRTQVHREACTMDLVRPASTRLHRSRRRAKGIQHQRTITFRSPRSHTRTSTTSCIPTRRPGRDRLSNQTHHPPCTIPKTTTIRR